MSKRELIKRCCKLSYILDSYLRKVGIRAYSLYLNSPIHRGNPIVSKIPFTFEKLNKKREYKKINKSRKAIPQYALEKTFTRI